MKGDENMPLTKLTMTESDREELRQSLHNWRQSDIDRELWLTRIAHSLGCDTHDALDIANGREGVNNLLDRLCIEVAPDDEPPAAATTLQDRLELAWAVVCGGGFWVVVAICIWMFFGEGGDE